MRDSPWHGSNFRARGGLAESLCVLCGLLCLNCGKKPYEILTQRAQSIIKLKQNTFGRKNEKLCSLLLVRFLRNYNTNNGHKRQPEGIVNLCTLKLKQDYAHAGKTRNEENH